VRPSTRQPRTTRPGTGPSSPTGAVQTSSPSPPIAVSTERTPPFADYDVRVVTERPGRGAFSTVVIGGAMDDLLRMGVCAGGGTDRAAGLSPLDCDGTRPRDIGFVAPECLPDVSLAGFRRLVAVAAAHEAGHLFGLEHVAAGSGSLMEPCASRMRWGRGEVLGSGECGRSVQNDPRTLRENVPRTVPPPPSPSPRWRASAFRHASVRAWPRPIPRACSCRSCASCVSSRGRSRRRSRASPRAARAGCRGGSALRGHGAPLPGRRRLGQSRGAPRPRPGRRGRPRSTVPRRRLTHGRPVG